VAALLPIARPAGAGLHVYDFDGALPFGATLVRTTSAIGEHGQSLAPDDPRFAIRAVASGARRLADLAEVERVLVAGEVDGVSYVVGRLGDNPSRQYPALTSDTPGLDPDVIWVEPHPLVIENFGSGGPWGKPSSAEILAEGTVLIHTQSIGVDRRSGTVRTSVGSFGDASGFELVRISDYAPPEGYGPAHSPFGFTRSTRLPNLGITVSAIVDYSSSGVASAVYPDGRALGYASSDAGASYVRVIDTDDPLLGAEHVDGVKHLHHLDPFEWLDPADSVWKIGAIGAVGDGVGAGQILVRVQAPSFPHPDIGSQATVSRTKLAGKHMITDLFPLNSSEQAGDPLRYLNGTDRAQAGIALLSIAGDHETDRILFQPTASFVEFGGKQMLNDWPYVIQMNRLANGAIVAPTWENKSEFTPEGIWVADASAMHWATAYARDVGFQGVKPTGANRFWTHRIEGSWAFSELWEIEPPVVRSSLLLGAAAREVASAAALADTVHVSVSDITGQIPGPGALPPSTPLLRAQSTSVPGGGTFDAGVAQPIDAVAGEFVSLVYWIKPMRDDLSVALLGTGVDLDTPAGVETRRATLDLDLNDWTRIVMTLPVPTGGASSLTPRFFAKENASPDLPLDYAFTRPQIVISSQPTIQPVADGAATAADQLTLSLPALGAEWSVAVWGTGARSLIFSLTSAGEWISVVPDHPSPQKAVEGRGEALRFEFSSAFEGGTSVISARRDVFFPDQDLVVLTRSPDGRIRMYASHGMGEIQELSGPVGESFTPDELRFGSVLWDRVFEGSLHRVSVWDSQALGLADVEQLRVTPMPEPSATCMLVSGGVCVGLLARLRARRRLRPRSRPASSPRSAKRW
jgi:hypothetical protein